MTVDVDVPLVVPAPHSAKKRRTKTLVVAAFTDGGLHGEAIGAVSSLGSGKRGGRPDAVIWYAVTSARPLR